MLVQKQVVIPGRYHLRDGRVFEIRADEVPYYARRLSDMVQHGLHIPTVWEHQSAAKPMTLSQWEQKNADLARLCIGHIHGASVDGKATFDAIDPKDRLQLQKTKYVSPQIEFDYTDPTGHFWPGPSITHVAVTPVPIQIDQTPFDSQPPFDTAFSDGASLTPVSLSAWQANPQAFAPQLPIRLSEARYEKMADDQDYKPDNDNDADDAAGEPAETPTPDEAPAPAPTPAPEPKSDREVDQELLDLLEQKGLVLGDDANIKNLVERLKVALKTHLAAAGGEEAPAEEPEEPEEATSGPEQTPMQESTPSPVMMSQLQAKVAVLDKITAERDALKKEIDAYKSQASAQKARADRLDNLLADRSKNDLKKRIDAIGSVFGEDVKRELNAELRVQSVSLSQNGNLHVTPLVAKIQAFERAMKAAPFAKVALSQLEQVQESGAPDSPAGSDTTNGVDADVVNRLSGGRYEQYRQKNGKPQ